MLVSHAYDKRLNETVHLQSLTRTFANCTCTRHRRENCTAVPRLEPGAFGLPFQRFTELSEGHLLHLPQIKEIRLESYQYFYARGPGPALAYRISHREKNAHPYRCSNLGSSHYHSDAVPTELPRRHCHTQTILGRRKSLNSWPIN